MSTTDIDKFILPENYFNSQWLIVYCKTNLFYSKEYLLIILFGIIVEIKIEKSPSQLLSESEIKP